MAIDNPNWDTRIVATNSTTATLATSSSWTNLFATSNFTVATASPIRIDLALVHQYEQGATNCAYRFLLLTSGGSTAATSDQVQVGKQGLGSNYAFGCHNMSYSFYNVAAGTYNVQVQGRNIGASSTTHKTTYFSPQTGLSDLLVVTYQA